MRAMRPNPARRRMAVVLIAVVLGALVVSCLLWARPAPEEAMGVQFVGLTNVPGLGTQALFNITNRTDNLLGIPGYGHVNSGESVTLPFAIPAGTGPWRVSVSWQCLDLSWFDMTMNRWRRRVEETLGLPRHVDAWFPPARVSRSPKMPR